MDRLVNRILVPIPKAHRVSLKDGVTIKGEIVCPSVEDVIKVDPSEAVRSQDISDLILENFETL